MSNISRRDALGGFFAFLAASTGLRIPIAGTSANLAAGLAQAVETFGDGTFYATRTMRVRVFAPGMIDKVFSLLAGDTLQVSAVPMLDGKRLERGDPRVPNGWKLSTPVTITEVT